MQPTSPNAPSNAAPLSQNATTAPSNAPAAPQPQVHAEAQRAPLTNTQAQAPVAAPAATLPAYVAPAQNPVIAAAPAFYAQQPANGMTRLMQAAHNGNPHTAQLLLQASGLGLAQQP